MKKWVTTKIKMKESSFENENKATDSPLMSACSSEGQERTDEAGCSARALIRRWDTTLGQVGQSPVSSVPSTPRKFVRKWQGNVPVDEVVLSDNSTRSADEVKSKSRSLGESHGNRNNDSPDVLMVNTCDKKREGQGEFMRRSSEDPTNVLNVLGEEISNMCLPPILDLDVDRLEKKRNSITNNEKPSVPPKPRTSLQRARRRENSTTAAALGSTGKPVMGTSMLKILYSEKFIPIGFTGDNGNYYTRRSSTNSGRQSLKMEYNGMEESVQECDSVQYDDRRQSQAIMQRISEESIARSATTEFGGLESCSTSSTLGTEHFSSDDDDDDDKTISNLDLEDDNFTYAIGKVLDKMRNEKNVVVYGLREVKVAETEQDNHELSLTNLLSAMKIGYIDFDDAYRLGPRIHGETRPFIIKFVRMKDKRSFLTCRGNLKGTGITIRQRITGSREKV